MTTIFFTMFLAASLGPIGPDAPREPQMAVKGSMVGLTFGAGKGIYFAASLDAGQSFSTPVKVAEAEIVPLSRHRGPRIVFSGDAIVISAVTGRTLSQGPHAHGLPSDGDLIAWRSLDGGKTWSKGTAINDVPGAPTEGLHSLAANGKGALFAVWLDKRGEKGTQLYGARSSDGGATWSRNIQIYQSPEGTICECCHPSAAIDSDGQILIMWRNWLAGSRDMYLARSADGISFAKPEKLGTGTWQLNACPMDGGGLALASNRIVTAWRRGGTLYMAEPGSPESALGEGKDVALAIGDFGVYAAWVDASGVVLRVPGKADLLKLAGQGAFPALARMDDGSLLAAWESSGGILTKRVQ